ncbi:MAG: peptidoglycan editing factor PgeF [Bacteroidales bacterium]|nr:peptidoglycan editing factor PgeF [Candidatus Scybalocola fimicaballi]
MNVLLVYLLHKIGDVSAFSTNVDCRFVENSVLFFNPSDVVSCKQTHSDVIKIVDDSMRGTEIADCDALVTNVRKLPLLIRTADCVPVVLYDPCRRVVANIHAGRVGAQKLIVRKTLQLMMTQFGSKTSDIIAAIGPHICGKCYEVDDACASEFGEKYIIGYSSNQKPLVDIALACKEQLVDVGVDSKNIHCSDICTAESKEWPSWRRDKCQERLGTFVMLE